MAPQSQSKSKSVAGKRTSEAPETSREKSRPPKRFRKCVSKAKTTETSPTAPKWYRRMWETAFDGGPEDSKVLHSFEDHISHLIWETGETTRDVTNFQMHHKPEAFNMWSLQEERNLEMIKSCNESGLSILWEAHSPGINKPLIHALLERYMPETNTFHLPIGEVTITLDDIFKITKLNIAGCVLKGERVTKDEGQKLLKDYLGIPSNDLSLNGGTEGSVSLKGLRETFKGKLAADETDRAKIDRYVRAFLLYVLGQTIFSDKSGSKVSLTFLRDLVDVDLIKEKAWGLAALAYLFRQLTISSKEDTQQLCGYVQLLEIWAYLHMPQLLPESTKSHPQWKESRAGRSNHTPYIKKHQLPKPSNTAAKLLFYRSFLDNVISSGEWKWYPYKHLKFQRICLFRGFLVCYDLYEPHPADRVRRQFGKIQEIPYREILKTNLTPHHGRDVHETILPFMVDMLKYYREYVPVDKDEFKVGVDEGNEVIHGKLHEDYYAWYKKISHLTVSPPSIAQRKKEEKYLDDVRVDVSEKLRELIKEYGEQKDGDMKQAFVQTLNVLLGAEPKVV